MTHIPDIAHWEEFQDHLERIPEVASYEFNKESGTAKVWLEDDIGELFVGRGLFTRVAHMGFIVGKISGDKNEIMFIDILGEHRGYLPEEVAEPD
jgi:hypothetical protein